MVTTARPKQWAKNALVLAAPAAAGVALHAHALRGTAIAFVAFCLAASGTYFLNDAADWQTDRLHPKKRLRPVAAGIVPRSAAQAAGAVLMALALGIASIASGRLALVVAIYLLVTISYTFALKQVAVVDLAAVAAGFVLRAIAGGIAADVPVSQWFLIVASFGSLFVVAGKRNGETRELGHEGSDHRATLGIYSAVFLNHVEAVCSAVALTAYCLWAFEKSEAAARPIWFELSIIPFVLAFLAYALRLDAGGGSAPEEILLRDRTVLLLGAAWGGLFLLGVYGV
jgi:decaprenyl-phosphate phosphoribosyltransferase